MGSDARRRVRQDGELLAAINPLPISDPLLTIPQASDPNVIGDPLLRTQHFIGGTKWEKVSDDEIIGYHQLRVPHQRYKDSSLKEVIMKGHAHSFNTHWYKKVDGVWKFAGLCPDIRWGEYDFDRIFEAGREEMGEKQQQQAAGIPTK